MLMIVSGWSAPSAAFLSFKVSSEAAVPGPVFRRLGSRPRLFMLMSVSGWSLAEQGLAVSRAL